MPPAAPPPGIYVPTLTFFKSTPKQELDLTTYSSHVTRLAKAGVRGIVLHHPLGEPHHLSRDERSLLISHTRSLLNALSSSSPSPPHRPTPHPQINGTHRASPPRLNGHRSPSTPPHPRTTPQPDVVLVVGASAPSTWETLELCEEAGALGGDFCLVQAPASGAAGEEGGLGERALEGYFFNIADSSPLPLLLAPHPSTPLPLPLLLRLAQHPNIVGLLLSSPSLCTSLSSLFPAKLFTPLATGVDELLPLAVAGAQGGVLPLGNIYPEQLVHLWSHWRANDLTSAQRAAHALARAGASSLERSGVRGIRAALDRAQGYGGRSRLPLLGPGEREGEEIGKVLELMEIGEGKGKAREGRGVNGFVEPGREH